MAVDGSVWTRCVPPIWKYKWVLPAAASDLGWLKSRRQWLHIHIGSRRVHSRALLLVGSGSLSLRVTTSGLNVQTWFVKLSMTDVKLGHRPKSEIRHSSAIYVSALLLKCFPDSQKSPSQRTHLLQMLKYETRGTMFCISEDQLNAKMLLRAKKHPSLSNHCVDPNSRESKKAQQGPISVDATSWDV